MHTLRDLNGPAKMALEELPEYTEEAKEVLSSGVGEPLYQALEEELDVVEEVSEELAQDLMKNIQKKTESRENISTCPFAAL